MDRAYSLLNVKAVNETATEWVIEGVASTPTADRMGDEVMPLGAKFALPMALLWQHDSQKPVGRVEFAKPTTKGIPYRAHLPKVAEAGTLKDRIDEAVQSIKYRLVAAVSIGFRALEGGVERIKETGGLRFKEWEWLELSLVTIPANAEASITSIKSLDRSLLAAPGRTQKDVTPSPGASGSAASRGTSSNRSPKGNPMKTLAELREQRKTMTERLDELLEAKGASETKKFTDDERTEFEGLKSDIADLDDEISVKQFHESNIATAQPVANMTQRSATGGRGLSFVRKADPDDKFKGQSYTRLVIAKALAGLNQSTPSAIAEHRWGKSNPQLVAWIKANEVAGGGTGSGEWGAELVAMDGRYTGDFIEFLYGATAFDKLPFREVPANVTIKGQDAEGTGYWVGESKAIPLTAPSYSTVNLSPLKVAALAVVSNDLIRYSMPSAEQLVANALREASAKRVDQTVFSAVAASAGVSPAGLLNGLTPIATTGTDEAAVIAMVSALYAPFITAKNSNGLYWVSGPAQAKAISLIRNALGQRAFDGVSGTGGTLEGDPLVIGDNIDGSQLILLKPSDIYKIGDSGFEVSISKEATIEQRSDPTGATDTPVGMNVTGMTNMFQEDSTAIKVVRHINFAKRRSDAVAFTDTADFSGTAS